MLRLSFVAVPRWSGKDASDKKALSVYLQMSLYIHTIEEIEPVANLVMTFGSQVASNKFCREFLQRH